MSLLTISAIVIFLIYIISTGILLILDNRRPQSTFAWLLLFIFVPLIGVLIYVFFGRSWRAFAKRRRLAKQTIGQELIRELAPDFTPPGEIIARLQEQQAPLYQLRLLELARRNSGSGVGAYNQVEILQDAREKYPRLLADLKQARHSIHLQYYIWTEDEFTLEIKEILKERARAGVAVRCLYDAFVNKLSWDYQSDLRAAGVAIEPYLRFDRLHSIHNLNYRGHRKIAIIDGKIGYIGGMNLDEEQIRGGSIFPIWRDTHLRIYGESTNLLQAIFVTSWYNTTYEQMADPDYFPNMRHEVCTFAPVQITSSGPDSQWRAIRQLYFFMITSAQRHVYIQSPFFILDESISEALKAAALSGVEVKIICQPRGATYNIPYRAAFTYYEELAQAGCEIYLYQAGYFHAKTIAIDSGICAVGTANMDMRSFGINYETIAVIYNEELTRQLEEDFCHDLKSCSKFDWRAYEKAPLHRRLRDSIYRLASPLL